MTDTVAAQLDSALALPDSYDFVNALSTLAHAVSQRMSCDYLELPPLVRMPLLLDELHLYASTKGMLVFLEMGAMGAKAPLMAEGCRVIGATRACEYLDAAGRLFPGGRIPASEDDIMAYADDVDDAERNFYALDKQYDGALDEMGECLRTFVRERRSEFERALTPPVEKLPPRPIPPGQGAFAQLKLIGERIAAADAKKAAEYEALRDAGVARGLVPWDRSATDPRFRVFAEAANALDEAAWRAISIRRFDCRTGLKKQDHARFALRDYLQGSGVIEKAQLEAARGRDWALLQPARDAIAELPWVEEDGVDVEVRRGAEEALFHATSAMLMHDWLMLQPAGVKAARVLYAFFEGYAPTPAIPKPKRAPRARKRA